jgi:DNA-binding transcriptional LysR family regulator
MDRFEAMSILVASVDAGSFSAAGRKLGMPLPTISRKVAELEEHLQTRLLVRTTRKLMLTEAGASYLAASKRILEQVSEAERAAAGEYNTPRGELILTAPIVFGRLHVLPVVNAFLAGFPEINVRLILSDRNVHLVDDHIDMAVRIGRLPDSSLIATQVGTIRRVTCASPAFLASHGTPKIPADLALLPCVIFDMVADGAAWTFASKDGRTQQSVRIQPRLLVNTAEAAIDAAIAGVGVTHVLSYQTASATQDGRLVRILQPFERPAVPVSLIHAGQGLLPLKMRSFVEFAAPRLRKALIGAD